MKTRERIASLLDEGINLYVHELLPTAPDSTLVFRGDANYVGKIKHDGFGEHIFDNEYFILKRKDFRAIARYEDGVEVATPHGLADAELESKLAENPELGYSFDAPLPLYLFSRRGLTEPDVADMFEHAEATHVQFLIERRGSKEKIVSGENVPIVIGRGKVYRHKDRSDESGKKYLYTLRLQHHRIISNPQGVWVPVVDFLLPIESYIYGSAVPAKVKPPVKKGRAFAKKHG